MIFSDRFCFTITGLPNDSSVSTKYLHVKYKYKYSFWPQKLIENGSVTNNFESLPTKYHFSSNIWEDFDVNFFYNMPIRYKFAEKKKTCWTTQCHVAAVKIGAAIYN